MGRGSLKWRLAWRTAATVGVAAGMTWVSAWGCAVWEQRDEGVVWGNTLGTAWSSKQVRTSTIPIPAMGVFGSLLASSITETTYKKPGTRMVQHQSSMRTSEPRWVFGWPRPCASVTMIPVPRPEWPPTFTRSYYGIEVAREGKPSWQLPVRIVWKDGALDLAFWGVLAGVPLVGVPLLRWWSRKRGGRCLECGYDRRSIACELPCPECGIRA